MRIARSAILCATLLGTTAFGLHMTRMPEKSQTTATEPQWRRLYFKLPLLQPRFHWMFDSRADFLAGSLSLRITRGNESTTIVVFANGRISDGWTPMDAARIPGTAEKIYFGFISSEKFRTAPNDAVEMEFVVTKDLSGIGAHEMGVLPAGCYITHGTYSGLIDDYAPPGGSKDIKPETAARLNARFGNMGFLENWDEQWPLTITEEHGWMPETRPVSSNPIRAFGDARDRVEKTDH